jgi:hypothetical protein
MVDLDRLEALERKATAGPWMPDGVRGLDLGHDLGIIPIWGSPPGADRDLILEARNALPALIRELRDARKIVEAVEAEIAAAPTDADFECGGRYDYDSENVGDMESKAVAAYRWHQAHRLRAALSRETTGGGE